MKVKASITLADDLLRAVDELARSSSRSEVIERALREFFAARARAERDARDLEIMNARADAYNVETADLMTYQTWIDLVE
ncbi:MAG TPA: ribbon-helix-helix protein, CopG family [Kofleriaceae bacterium]|jgi:metal-responsive CopG/Arc/MetJ family transcriptional regulator|nr:ribbon-helix-helix protein, CopG family [Kofleriaceae bacterium]